MNTRLKAIDGSDWFWRIKNKVQWDDNALGVGVDTLVLRNAKSNEMLLIPWPSGMTELHISHMKVIKGGKSAEVA